MGIGSKATTDLALYAWAVASIALALAAAISLWFS